MLVVLLLPLDWSSLMMFQWKLISFWLLLCFYYGGGFIVEFQIDFLICFCFDDEASLTTDFV